MDCAIASASSVQSGTSAITALSQRTTVQNSAGVVSALPEAAADSKAKRFVLVRGLGHEAWCWYKAITFLQDAGHTVTPLDLTSNGNNKFIADDIADVAHFVQPLTDFLADYEGKVILVGHSFGGSTILYAMEAYPEKIEKAVFLAALMPTNGQTFLPIRDFVGL